MIKKYNQTDINELAEILKNDGAISVPTDTVYGVCAKINSQKAKERLVKVKNRPKNKSFPVMCADEEQIKSIAIVNENAQKLIKAFMPGPITLVLKKKEDVSTYVTDGKDTIAVRMATSEFLKKLILKTESPLFMTSANKSGESTCQSIEQIEESCPLLDGITEGEVKYSEGSTIVDCTNNKVKILRLGPITPAQIKNQNIEILD